MSDSLIDRAREGRKSPQTLKIKASNLRSRYPGEPILIVEGPDDVGPYETWIRGEQVEHFLHFLPGNGKEQLLGLRRMLSNDETGLKAEIYFFVDRDFDGLQGQAEGSDIYCCDRYSIENYLSTNLVVKSVLRDEFRLDPASAEYETVVRLYEVVLRELTELLKPVNRHLFICQRLGLKLHKGIPEVKKMVDVQLERVTLRNSVSELIGEQLLTSTEVPEYDTAEIDAEFCALDPMTEHRGKFLYEFLRSWLNCLAEDVRALPNGKYVPSQVNSKFSLASFDLRSCASRSERPAGLRQFVQQIFVPAQDGLAA
ncbi:Protein of unknown function [Caballeronia arationis]|jgi:hypothetical protein|uniref:DUF4435 domain-containing protein n=1 Tax=Caballeronia arationis TaxID=1777142 RepID=A0A7Z7IGB2_9BURK|nr:DUF4435 domain-containing protein [Caballeronia arationis]SOE91200.1 Protein of unknown function [Caballeronia arationis]